MSFFQQFHFLHQHNAHTYSLDHRLLPEVRAMLAAMVSRMPVGGIVQRYRELRDEVLAEMWEAEYLSDVERLGVSSWEEALEEGDDLLYHHGGDPDLPYKDPNSAYNDPPSTLVKWSDTQPLR